MSTPSDRAESIVDAALDLTPAERQAYLDNACGDDVPLRQTVEALIRAHQHALAPTMQITSLPPSTGAERLGDIIGPYKLLQRIGEGGCGVVYMAEQTSPVSRRVALKVIKPGMDTKQVIARFEAERQALALMDHPNIAKILEAGATDTGRPFFVMELVRGIKITEYCDQSNLPTQKRLELFIQVCQAVQHAHQKGVIHRDLKPSNILVTLHDGLPVPKVIDFGIAKATAQRLTDKTVFTAFQQFIGTPAYMSPEQAEMSGLDIDTRSDIYSLGVLLYELLTSRIPFDAKELAAAGLDEMRRIIREKDPVRPSTKLSSLNAADQTTVGRQRQLEVAKLIHLVRGDLDWIVMKCLEKDRTRRYETANGLAADIRRHLENEPVVACPPSTAYRFRKLIRRNKLAFASAMAVGAALLLGTAIATWQAVLARAEKVRADEQTALATTVNNFLREDLLRQAGTAEQIEGGNAANPDLTVKEALDRAAKQIGDRFRAQPLAESQIRRTIGDAYVSIGRAEQGLPHLERAHALQEASLGRDNHFTLATLSSLARATRQAGKLPETIRLYEDVLRQTRLVYGPDHTNTLISMHNLGEAYRAAGQVDRATELFSNALVKARVVLTPDDGTTLSIMNGLATIYGQSGQFAKAIPLYEEVLVKRRIKLTPDHPKTLISLNNLAMAYLESGQPTNALPLLEDALKRQKAVLGPDDPGTVLGMNNLAMAFARLGRFKEALPLLESAFATNKSRRGPDHPDTLGNMFNLGRAYQFLGDLPNALPLLEGALAGRRIKLNPDHPDTLRTAISVLTAYASAGKSDKALVLYEEYFPRIKAKFGPSGRDTLLTMDTLAQAYNAAGQFTNEEQILQARWSATQTASSPDSADVAGILARLGTVLLRLEKYPEAESVCHKLLATREKTMSDHYLFYNAKSMLGASFLGQKNYTNAEPPLLSGYEGMKQREDKIPAAGKARLKEALQRVVQLYEATGQSDKAAEWKQKLADFDKARLENPSVAP